jgi:hypothetical protein
VYEELRVRLKKDDISFGDDFDIFIQDVGESKSSGTPQFFMTPTLYGCSPGCVPPNLGKIKREALVELLGELEGFGIISPKNKELVRQNIALLEENKRLKAELSKPVSGDGPGTIAAKDAHIADLRSMIDFLE